MSALQEYATHRHLLAEMMARQAAIEHDEGQAEAMLGAAVIASLSATDGRALQQFLPYLIRGMAIITRMLRRRPGTRLAVRAVPIIVRRTVRWIRCQSLAGRPVTRRALTRAVASQVQQVLGNRGLRSGVIAANIRANRDCNESALFETKVSGGTSAVAPFPRYPYVLGLEMTNEELSNCAATMERDPDTRPMCGAIADLTGSRQLPPFYAHNPVDMVYVGSLAKIYAMYAAFELRKRVQQQVNDMIKLGLSTTNAGWERHVFSALENAWRSTLRTAFPSLPEGMPKFSEIFAVSSSGQVKFAESDPPLTDGDLDFRPPNPAPGKPAISPEFKQPPGKFRDWMRLMLRWSNDKAASMCIRALGYPYINGVLSAAGFFNKSTRSGLWISGDYLGHDWLKANAAGQPLSPRWARLQGRKLTNFAGTAFQVARLLVLLAQHRLVDPQSSSEMISIMTGVKGIGSYIRGALVHATPPRPYTAIASKIGCGDEALPCGFTHDCGIVRVDRNRDPARTIRYVVVALGGHPHKSKADLRKMVVRFHDCVLAQHP